MPNSTMSLDEGFALYAKGIWGFANFQPLHCVGFLAVLMLLLGSQERHSSGKVLFHNKWRKKRVELA